MSANFCSNCGNRLAPSDRFCGKCGTAIASGESAQPPTPAAPQEAAPPPAAAPAAELKTQVRSFFKNLIYAVLGLIGVIIGLGMLHDGGKDKSGGSDLDKLIAFNNSVTDIGTSADQASVIFAHDRDIAISQSDISALRQAAKDYNERLQLEQGKLSNVDAPRLSQPGIETKLAEAKEHLGNYLTMTQTQLQFVIDATNGKSPDAANEATRAGAVAKTEADLASVARIAAIAGLGYGIDDIDEKTLNPRPGAVPKPSAGSGGEKSP